MTIVLFPFICSAADSMSSTRFTTMFFVYVMFEHMDYADTKMIFC